MNPYSYVHNPTGYVDPYGLAGRQGNKGDAGIKETGARRVLDPDSVTGWEKAEKYYDKIRADPSDISAIARNTGWKESQIARIKNHVFFKEHQLDRGIGRFDADPGMVNAWSRLTKGDHIPSDINLLKHEYFESKFEGIFRTNYRTAHDKTESTGRIWIDE
ncbi:hypothetical protein WDV75_03790 [Xenorhabdus griffiniae]